MTTWLVVLLLIWPLLWVLRLFLIAKALLGFEFCRARAAALPPAGVPAHLNEAAQPWITQLRQLGFREIGSWRLGLFADSAMDEEAVVLVCTTAPVRAVIRVRGEAARSGECWLSLRSTRTDGSEIITANHAPEELCSLPPGIDTETLVTAQAHELFQRHLARVAAPGAPLWNCPGLAEAVRRESELWNAVLGHAVGTNQLVERAQGDFSYRPVPALRRAARLIQHASRQKKADQAVRMPVATLSEENQNTFDLQHYRQTVAVARGRLSLRTKAVLTAVSFLLFAGVLAWQYSSIAVAVTLVIALVVHEGGHLLGMWMFGYRDTQLLFIPFLGGAAIGHDDKVLHPWQHIVIILLGPLPGIFIGLALLTYAGGADTPAWVTEAAITTLVLNAFNLLPILPLDGGQIVDFAVASRFPRARVIFLGLSAAGMVLLALVFDGVKLLLGLGILALLRLPVEWRLAGVRQDIREEFPNGGEEEPVVRRLIASLRAPEWAKVAMAQRLQLVRGLQQVLRMPKPGFGTMCFALAGFTAPLWLGTPLAVWAAVRQGEAQVARAEARARAAGLLKPLATKPPAAVAPEDNAAVAYERAAELAEQEKPEAEIVAQLRIAARKKVFVPTAKAATDHRGLWAPATLLGQLTNEATEKMRYQEPAEAVAVIIDTLRLMRLMQQAPGALDWTTYHYLAGNCWNTLEEALATGVVLSPGVRKELRELADERVVVDYAATAIPRSLCGFLDSMPDQSAEAETGALVRLLAYLSQISPTLTHMRVQMIDQAIVAQGELQAVTQGRWPKQEPVKPTEEGGPGQAALSLAQLGDLLARQRQVRVVLLLTERRAGAAKPVRLEDLGPGAADLQHPFTREQMRLVKRGAMEVLTFKAGLASVWQSSGEEGDPDETNGPDLVWRVPGTP